MNPLVAEALKRREKLKEAKAKERDRPKLKIYDCMQQCSPKLQPPVWFDSYVEALDNTIDEKGRPQEVNLTFSGPPQHGKTEIAKHAFVSLSQRAPGLSHAYATYNFTRAIQVARKVRDLCALAGLNPKLREAEGELNCDGGTQIRFVGLGGGLTGNPISGLTLIDDPTKDRQDAESKVIRERGWEWLTDVAQTRRHPGSSCVAMATRWHVDDMIGRLIKLFKWVYLRIPAECDSEDDVNGRAIGEALWEAGRPSTWLQQFKNNPYTWASMYQGRPRPRGEALFGEPTFYTELPTGGVGFTRGNGADLAYSEKTRSDWSVLLQGRRYGKKVYLTNEIRRQCQSPEFTDIMARATKQSRTLWLCSGTEKGTAQHIKRSVKGFTYRIASADKYVRATPAAQDGWNLGNILVPEPDSAEWVSDFVDEVCGFTGVKDLCDDRVDALAALWKLLGVSGIAEEAKDLNSGIKRAVQESRAQQIRSAFRR